LSADSTSQVALTLITQRTCHNKMQEGYYDFLRQTVQ